MSQFFISGGQSISFSFSISPSNEYSGLISFRRTGWISLQSKGLSRVFSSTTVQKHQFFGVHTGKTIALTRRTFVGKVMSLLFNTLSRLVIDFLPRCKCLLISWSGYITNSFCCTFETTVLYNTAVHSIVN